MTAPKGLSINPRPVEAGPCEYTKHQHLPQQGQPNVQLIYGR